MVFGTFDILHPGHIYFLKEAKKMGSRLIVVVARDENVIKLKGKRPLYNCKQRINQIKKTHLADKIISGDLIDIFKCIKVEKPDIIALGYDQKYFIFELKQFIKKREEKIKIMKIGSYYPSRYKSSIIKNKLKK